MSVAVLASYFPHFVINKKFSRAKLQVNKNFIFL